MSDVPEVGYTDDLSRLSILNEDTLLSEIEARFLDSVYYVCSYVIVILENNMKRQKHLKKVSISKQSFFFIVRWYTGFVI